MKRLEVKRTEQAVERLGGASSRLVEAATEDGWPEAMARAGLDRHFRTWDVERLAACVEGELIAVDESPDHRFLAFERIHHIWPALPGAGVTPVLVGMLLGGDQKVRSSSRGRQFSRVCAELLGIDRIEPDGDWADADVVVVSGTDETVLEVRRAMAGRGRVVGYGHRVSFAVVIDTADEVLDLGGVASSVAEDIAMWHGRGCFSVRAVLFCGTEKRRGRFCERLAESIADLERRWGTGGITDGELGRRAQKMGVAEMQGRVFCDGIGYVRVDSEPFDGSCEAIHSVTVHPVGSAGQLAGMVDVAPTGLQAAAVAGGDDRWRDALLGLGVTRICSPGTLQTPPADWFHDGLPNALSMGRVVTLR